MISLESGFLSLGAGSSSVPWVVVFPRLLFFLQREHTNYLHKFLLFGWYKYQPFFPFGWLVLSPFLYCKQKEANTESLSSGLHSLGARLPSLPQVLVFPRCSQSNFKHEAPLCLGGGVLLALFFLFPPTGRMISGKPPILLMVVSHLAFGQHKEESVISSKPALIGDDTVSSLCLTTTFAVFHLSLG